MGKHGEAMYGARVNFMDTGSIEVRLWAWDGERNDRHEVVLDRILWLDTCDEVDRLDYAAYLLGRAFRDRADALRRRLATTASTTAHSPNDAPRSAHRASTATGGPSDPERP